MKFYLPNFLYYNRVLTQSYIYTAMGSIDTRHRRFEKVNIELSI